MQKKLFALFLILGIILTVGCSLCPVRFVVVKGKSVDDRRDIPLMDPNDPNKPYKIEAIQEDNEEKLYELSTDIDIKQEKPCRVRYCGFHHFISRHIVVEGKLKNNKKYPIILDTGASPGAIIVNDIHIMENKLSIYPLGNNDSSLSDHGFCYIPELQVGNTTFTGFPGWYVEEHDELQIFGLAITHGREMVIGLPILSEFKYLLFDGVKKEAELSANKVFEPEMPELWDKYSFLIKKHPELLVVEIPINMQNIKLRLDTGAGLGLMISENAWEEMSDRFHNVKLKDTSLFSPAYGKLSGKKCIIQKLSIGNRIIKNAKISILPNDCPLFVKNSEMLIGMQYFRDTTIVLDFERNLMWIRK